MEQYSEIDNAEFEREMRALLSGNHPRAIYSRKVFLGGLPLCTNAGGLLFLKRRVQDMSLEYWSTIVLLFKKKGGGSKSYAGQ